mgnify:CR=1 FL=1
MTKIIFATGNKDKLREIKEILSDCDVDIRSMKEAGINVDIVEDGKTFEDNALIKARAIAAHTDAIVLADDSGLEIDYLNKEPGVYSARYMGEDTSYDIKNNNLIERLDGVPKEKRTARFVCAIAAVLPDGKELVTRQTMEGYIGWEIAGAKLQEGSMRADVNLSVREVGAEEFGTRTEMKNLNSFKAIARAIEGERERQIELIEEGKAVTQETRRWDDNKEYSYAMRSKEDAKDYRYFPDPDLPPIHISDAWIEKIKAEQPELREVKQARYQEEYGLPAYDAGILTESRHLAGLFEETAAIYGNAKKTANWFMGEVLRLTKDKAMDAEQVSFSPKHLADLLVMVEKSEVSPQNAKKVFEKVFAEDIDPVAYIEEHGLKIVEDTGLLEETINRILDANPGPLSELLGGKDKVMGFFVGQIMKEMKGKANPASARETLMKEVEKRK